MYTIDLPIKNEEGLELRFCAAAQDAAIWLPRFTYLFNNNRIRGIDYHASYINHDGNRASGWHEHLWNDKLQMAPRYPNDGFQHVPRDNQIDYVLKRWTIEYKEQLRLDFQE